MQEVSRVRSTNRKDARFNPKLQLPIGKEQIQRKKLHPQYIAGFIDGEGSFSVSIGKHKTLRRGFEVRPEFEIELRKDDQEILERNLVTIGIGKIYDCSYERYGWYPHAKYKITSIWDLKVPLAGRCCGSHGHGQTGEDHQTRAHLSSPQVARQALPPRLLQFVDGKINPR